MDNNKINEAAFTKQIKTLVLQEQYEEALKIIEEQDISRVKNASMLCLVGEVYMGLKRYDDAEKVLLRVYERQPSTRRILDLLTTLYIEKSDYSEAEFYYKEFIGVASRDMHRYILRYRLDKGKGERLSVLIDTLEKLKDVEYIEEWAFELASLYERSGQEKKAIRECDEIVLWFGHGEYVDKAIALKCKLTGEPLPEITTVELHRAQETRAQIEAAVAVDISEDLENEFAGTIDTELIKQVMDQNVAALNAGRYDEPEEDDEDDEDEILPEDAPIDMIPVVTADVTEEVMPEVAADVTEEVMPEDKPVAIVPKVTAKVPSLKALREAARQKETAEDAAKETAAEAAPGQVTAQFARTGKIEPAVRTLTMVEDEEETIASEIAKAAQPAEETTKFAKLFGGVLGKVKETSASVAASVLEKASDATQNAKNKKTDPEAAKNADRDEKILNGEIEVLPQDELDDETREMLALLGLSSVEELDADDEALLEEEAEYISEDTAESESVMTEEAESEAVESESIESVNIDIQETLTEETETLDEAAEVSEETDVVESIEEVTEENVETEEVTEETEADQVVDVVDETEAVEETEVVEETGVVEETEVVEEFEASAEAEALEVEVPGYEDEDEDDDEVIEESFEETEKAEPLLAALLGIDACPDDLIDDEDEDEDEETEDVVFESDLTGDESIDDDDNDDDDDEIIDEDEIESDDDLEFLRSLMMIESDAELFDDDDDDDDDEAKAWEEDLVEDDEEEDDEDDEEDEISDNLVASDTVLNIFGSVAGVKSIKQQLAKTFTKFEDPELESMDLLAPYDINFIVTGDDMTVKSQIAIGIAKALNTYGICDKNKLVRATAADLNGRENFGTIFGKLSGGCLIIEGADQLNDSAARVIEEYVKADIQYVAIVLEGPEEAIRKLLSEHPILRSKFLNIIHIGKYNVSELVQLAVSYAKKKGYEVPDESKTMIKKIVKGRIADKGDVEYEDIITLVEDAIQSLEKRNMKNLFMTVLDNKYEEAAMFTLLPEDWEQL